MLLTGCGSSGTGSPTSVEPKKYQKALAFVQCMRTHGEPTFPDPTSQGIISDSQLNPGSPVLRAAGRACGSPLPPGSLQLTEAQQEQISANALKRSVCMRAHGVSNFPDPTGDGLSMQGKRIDPASPVFRAAARACDLGLGGGSGARAGG